MRDPGAAAADRAGSAPAAAEPRELAAVVRLRYVGGATALISGPATRRTYRFSRLQPSQLVDVRDAVAMLRTRLFVRTG